MFLAGRRIPTYRSIYLPGPSNVDIDLYLTSVMDAVQSSLYGRSSVSIEAGSSLITRTRE